MNIQSYPERPNSQEYVSKQEKSTAQRKIYLPAEKKFIEVSEDVYFAYYRPIWKVLKNAQRKGECCCPVDELWKCGGECNDCPYRVESDPDEISQTTAIQEHLDLTIMDALPSKEMSPENAAISHDFLSALKMEIDQLSPLDREICLLYLSGMTEREIASEVNRSRSKVNEHKHRILMRLKSALQEYYQ